MNIPSHLRYTKDHEWVKIEGDFAWIGITDYAQGELGDIVFVELPGVGTRLEQGKSFGTIEAVKAVSDLYAPVDGEVVEINSLVSDTAEIINKEPYDSGWMIKIKLASESDHSHLLDAGAYKELIGSSESG